MAREVTTIDKAILALVIIAILISAGTLAYVMPLAELAGVPAKIEELSGTTADLAAAEADLGRTLGDVGKTVGDLAKTVGDLTGTVGDLAEAVGLYAERVEALEGTIKALEEASAALEKRSAALEERIAGVEEAVKPPLGPSLKVGIFGPMTGPAAKSGLNFWDGCTMALEECREQGLVPILIDGVYRDVELVKVDSESDPEKALKATEYAIEREGVEIFVTGWHSSVAMEIHEISTRYGIIHIGHMGETQFLCVERAKNPDASRYWFKGWPCPPIFAGLYAPPLLYLIEEGLWTPKTTKFVILVEETDFGRGWGDAIKVSLEEGMGWEMAYYDVVSLLPAPEVEFYPLLEKYMAAEVSLIAFTSTASASHAALLKQARELEVPALLVPHGMGWFAEWYELAGEASDYTVAMDSPRTYLPRQREWAKRFEDRFGYEPSLAAGGHSYDYFMIAIKALTYAGTLDPEVLRSTIIDRKWPGVCENYYWPSTDQPWAHYMEPRVGKGWYFYPMVQLMEGKAPIIWPPEYAEATFEQPPWLE